METNPEAGENGRQDSITRYDRIMREYEKLDDDEYLAVDAEDGYLVLKAVGEQEARDDMHFRGEEWDPVFN